VTFGVLAVPSNSMFLSLALLLAHSEMA